MRHVNLGTQIHKQEPRCFTIDPHPSTTYGMHTLAGSLAAM